jgi:hypothetical protein
MFSSLPKQRGRLAVYIQALTSARNHLVTVAYPRLTCP